MQAVPPPDPGPAAPDPGAPLALSVVMPAHNEQDYLEAAVTAVVDGLGRRGAPFEVVVVENGSSDDTAGVAATMVGRHPEVRLLTLPDPDYGRALRAGLLGAGGRLVVTFDVDFVDLAFLDTAVRLQETTGADIVVGSKRGPGADDTRPLSRRVVTWGFSSLLRHGFGLGVSDTHGVKLLRRASTADLAEACTSGTDIFDTELILRAERAGRIVTEVPVRVTEQRPPRTAIASRIPRTLLGLGRLRLRLWTDPAVGHRRRG